MPYAAGVFTLVAGNPVVTNTIVSSTWANNTLSDIATGLSTAVLKDGTQVATAQIPFVLGAAAPFFWGTGVGSYGKVSKRMSADQTVAVTAMTTVTALSLTVAANEEWQADYFLQVSNATVPGATILVTTPAGASVMVSEKPLPTDGSNTQGSGDVTVNATVPFLLMGNAVGPNHFVAEISLWVLNGVTPGTVDIKLGQATATSSGLLCRKGSHMYATRLA